jgi:hypothetical protein
VTLDPTGTVCVIDVYERDDLGTPALTLTDGNIFAGPLWREAENEVGAVGPFLLRRDHPDAALFRVGMYVTITVPGLNSNARFGGWLNEGYDTVIGEGEEGSEVIARGGPGTVAILSHMRLLDDWHAPVPPASDFRGTGPNIDGKWTWINEAFGSILVRVIEEGQNQPGVPLDGVSIDFDRTDDTLNNPWDTFSGTVEMDIGTNGLEAYDTLIASGQLYVRADPDLTIHAYADSTYGVDRTSTTFATGKVRFVKGVNILSGLDREAGDATATRNASGRGAPVGSIPGTGGGRGAPSGSIGGSTGPVTRGGPAGGVGGSHRTGRDTHATHALVEGKDHVYRQIVSPLYTTGAGRWTRVPYNESNDNDLLDNVGGETLRRGAESKEALTLEMVAGNDESVGLYKPYIHFKIGDYVTVYTGTGDADYDNEPARVTGISCVLLAASDDTNVDAQMGSLRWIIELNGSPGSVGSRSPATTINPGVPGGASYGILGNAPQDSQPITIGSGQVLLVWGAVEGLTWSGDNQLEFGYADMFTVSFAYVNGPDAGVLSQVSVDEGFMWIVVNGVGVTVSGA